MHNVHINHSQKRSFSKTLFKNAAGLFFFPVDVMTSWYWCDLSARFFLSNTNSKWLVIALCFYILQALDGQKTFDTISKWKASNFKFLQRSV